MNRKDALKQRKKFLSKNNNVVIPAIVNTESGSYIVNHSPVSIAKLFPNKHNDNSNLMELDRIEGGSMIINTNYIISIE